ncbi:MAG: hypothetical protein PWP65_1816 [Clostridia bacterium]|nr:hypothetical protein [Clostridia bacterium]
MEWDLLEKTTFWIEGIELDGVKLDLLAREAAAVLNLKPGEVMVVDVRPNLVAFDILRKKVVARDIIGKGETILARLQKLPGVNIKDGASVHSEGVLGFLALDPDEAGRVLKASQTMAQNIAQAVAGRALVFASGSEVQAGNIQDTNSPFLLDALRRAGFKAEFGGVLPDDVDLAAAGLEEACGRGFGLILTTGGVGAEDKDCTIEAVCRLDPAAATPWILKFHPDYSRHHKEGVRIAVGQVGLTTIVALPGPHEEAKLGCQRLLEGLSIGLRGQALAEHIAAALRQRWRFNSYGGDDKHGHPGISPATNAG